MLASVKLYIAAMKRIVPFISVVILATTLTCCLAPRSSTTISGQTNPLRIAVISDLNSSYGSVTYNPEVAAVIAELIRQKPAMVLCAGDMVAGQKRSLTEENIEAMWRNFDSTVLQPLAKANIPFAFTLGNHDASPTFALDRLLAKQFWKAKVQATNLQFVDSTHYPFYFSYLQNDVFFLSWDASGSKVPTEVFDWMQQQLTGKIARASRLRILLGHLPLYPIVQAKNKAGEVVAAADSALYFFKGNNLDLYISGHQHAWYPATKEGFSLLNAGCIGDGERPIMGNNAAPAKAYSILEIPAMDARNFRYLSYSPQGNLIPSSSLPDSVVGFNGTVIKDERR